MNKEEIKLTDQLQNIINDLRFDNQSLKKKVKSLKQEILDLREYISEKGVKENG